ncbi:hypothetical protein COLO4_28350 [Corchorus olitorius]|uniref:Uncharacterized protein n=1 Tax=Corchorus olitorius TaxID=93759 RepID=A0A1R3HLN9_9ROSI|nr:hypothetical protein COLO4_28350 [Corchorus olitorius]
MLNGKGLVESVLGMGERLMRGKIVKGIPSLRQLTDKIREKIQVPLMSWQGSISSGALCF